MSDETLVRYLRAYPETVQHQAARLLKEAKVAGYLRSKYPSAHSINTDKLLRSYVMAIKSQYLKSTDPLNKVVFDAKIHLVHNALGTHHRISRQQGGKLKRQREIRISHLFKRVPEPFLNMIVVHELAHLRELDHNKSFYRLCEHMLPDYHQLEFEMRLFLTEVELRGNFYTEPPQ
ncbi:YgjP-like metallopeptidase domain-containing protein [Neptunomonas marina]|uniref:M48 family peptidase n=1 Tax=Neptunomonas marina TaxID=1815562 RepID=A0A437Q6H6_9GAMM|nr:YgjP-like metallopeptidase domain-containing protein [Neptunomonas marina]RVU30121.1 M48 family peptidase [Neptunomonas marina]